MILFIVYLVLTLSILLANIMRTFSNYESRMVKGVLSSLKTARQHAIENRVDLQLEKLNISKKQSEKLKEIIMGELYEIPLHWQNSTNWVTLLSPKPEPDPYELINCFRKKSYASYFCALYFNELTNQLPKTFHISYERSKRSRIPETVYGNLDFFDVRDSFMKKPRLTQNIVTYKSFKYEFVEREPTDDLGVVQKRISLKKGVASFSVTDRERTLIDCLVAPHRAGGIDSVISSFISAKKKLSIEKLHKYYVTFDFVYPYWQRIGFILERALGEKPAKKWESRFSGEKHKFFLMREYRSSWLLDERWQIYYPKGLDF